MSKPYLWKTKFLKIPKFFLVFLVIFGWVFSGWPSGLSFAQEATSTPAVEPVATSTPETTSTATSTVDTSILTQISATSTPAEIASPASAEEKLAPKSFPASLFGAFFDVFFGEPGEANPSNVCA